MTLLTLALRIIAVVCLYNVAHNLWVISADIHAMSAATVEAADTRARIEGQQSAMIKEWESCRFDNVTYKPEPPRRGGR